MSDLDQPVVDLDEADPERSASRRGRSSIKFPYSDISDAITVAQKVKALGGNRCSLDQLAAGFGQSISSGAFRTKVATAGTFGAIKSSRGNVDLTDLGHRLADEHSRPAALAEAFLCVPLYKLIYDSFEGRALPEDAGLESTIRSAGVMASQTDRARQVFQRSALKAGFFWGGKNRLVMPAAATLVQPDMSGARGDAGEIPPTPSPDGEGSRPLADPMIVGVFDRLVPSEGEQFSAHERRRFFRALANVLDVIYGEPADGEFDADEVAKLYKVHGQGGQRSGAAPVAAGANAGHGREGVDSPGA